MIKKNICSLLHKCGNIPFVQRILQDHFDSVTLRHKLTNRERYGILLVLLSYVIGWPAVALLGILSAYFKEPFLLLVCAPLSYAISHVIFIVGAYMAGKEYAMFFLKWSIKKIFDRVKISIHRWQEDVAKIES